MPALLVIRIITLLYSSAKAVQIQYSNWIIEGYSIVGDKLTAITVTKSEASEAKSINI